MSEFEDKRSRKIIYMSSCLLNQNRRFPGIAVSGGAIYEVVEPLLNREVGIEQLPCLECIGWGGVSKKSFLRMIPTYFRYADSRLSPVIRSFSRVWLWNYQRLCKRAAKKVADEIEDFKNSGYEILGIVGADNSPTCGVTKTQDLLSFIPKLKRLGVTLEDLEAPKLERLAGPLMEVLSEGQGTFIRELSIALKRKKISTKIIGFDAWGDFKDEAERIMNAVFAN